MGCLLSEISDAANILTSIAAIVGGVFVYKEYIKSKQTFRHQIMNDYFKEYRSTEMGHSIKMLWTFWRDCGGISNKFGDKIVKENMIKKYTKHYNDTSSSNDDSLHNNRRKVSSFFQQIAILAAKDKETKNIIYEVWHKWDLNIIIEIICPIEMECLEKEIKGRALDNREQYPQYMLTLISLAEDAPD